MNFRGLAASICFLAASLPYSFAQAALQEDLSRVMQEAVKQRQRYVESFKDLTAVETKTTEIVGKNGKVEDRRVVISDFLVYESRLKAGVVNEYRITKIAVNRQSKAKSRQWSCSRSFTKAKTLEQEGNRLRDENMKHTLRYYRWGVTLQLAPQLQFSAGYEYESGAAAPRWPRRYHLKYKQKNQMAGEVQGLTRNFKDQTGNRGRLWLDPETFQVWCWENESTVIDQDIPTESVLVG
jgi:hypothetical protein